MADSPCSGNQAFPKAGLSEMRRVSTLHTLVAFGFNTAILATMINLAANLF
jgi:uncharacterized membrane protein